MSAGLDQLLNRYENGHITRRELIGALSALVVAAPAATAAEPPIGAVKQINHVSIFVPDVQKSVKFYQDLLGMPVLTLDTVMDASGPDRPIGFARGFTSKVGTGPTASTDRKSVV